MKPLSPCIAPGCGKLIGREGDGSYRGRCAQHARGHERQRYQMEPGRKNYQKPRWQRLSKAQLMREPLCLACKWQGRVSRATVTDHIRRHGGSEELFWSQMNHCSLDGHCHTAKTNAEHNKGTFDLAGFIAFAEDYVRRQHEAYERDLLGNAE